MTWRVAGSLEVLLDQINKEWPSRSRISDGSIGDTAHATRTSDHNPWVPPPNGGVVTARDFTHDPAHGADMAKVSETLRKSKDSRIKYVIFNGRMFSSYPAGSSAPWTWRSYTGVNSHAAHMHLSVQPTGYDNTKPWDSPGEKDWFDMASKADLREVVREELEDQRKLLAVGRSQKGYDADNVNLREIMREIKANG